MFNLGPTELLVFVVFLAILIGSIALGVNFGIRLARRRR